MRTVLLSMVYLLTCIVLLINACKKSGADAPAVIACNPTYSGTIQPIIMGKCAVSGCHGAGSPLGDYTKAETVKTRADNGNIGKYVYDLKIMPPASKDSLTTTEKDQLKCWLDNGAPQN